jgi:uncharacterized membrane protein
MGSGILLFGLAITVLAFITPLLRIFSVKTGAVVLAVSVLALIGCTVAFYFQEITFGARWSPSAKSTIWLHASVSLALLGFALISVIAAARKRKAEYFWIGWMVVAAAAMYWFTLLDNELSGLSHIRG